MVFFGKFLCQVKAYLTIPRYDYSHPVIRFKNKAQR
jgi:hypothetical protein